MIVQFLRRPTLRRRVLPLAAAGIAICGSLVATLPAGAAPSGPPPVAPGSRYLALGDSLSFGYREPGNLPVPDYKTARSFVGFPEVVAKDLGLKLTNGSCPGETSGSMIAVKAPTNGCERGVGNVGRGYRGHYPLKTGYSGSQLSFAIDWLKYFRGTRLLTLSIGADDVALCQATTTDHCASATESSAMVAKVKNHVFEILQRLRRGARYKGQIVVVNDYSPNYSDPAQTSLAKALNKALASSASRWQARVARSFQAFHHAAAQAHGDACAAGLLTILQAASTPCGAEPSVAGQALLASSVEQVTAKS